jgi:phosphotransferase system HPr-like phosphotransfer protein
MKFQKTVCDISFSEKARIFSHDYLKACIYISKFNSSRYLFTKKLFSELIATSQVLEDFLDFHGAKNNKEWFFYRELTAAVRHLSLGGYSQTHILNRLDFYGLPDTETFEKEGTSTLYFIRKTIMKLAPIILNEARRLNIPIPDESYDMAEFPGIITGEILDYNIDDTDKDQQKKHIVKIASEFLSIAATFDHLRFYEPYDREEILKIVPEKVNEVNMRRFEMLVHNIQSSFDTYVIHGGYRFGNRKLKDLRGYFSVVFHLLQMIGRLLHFYERHLHKAGYKNIYKKVQDRLSAMIDPEELLDRTINYGFYYVWLGFHSRPSLLVAKTVQYYGGQVELCVGQDRFDASSVLDIQWAGGKIQKENIAEVTFEGDTRALKDIEILAGVNYGEDTMGKGIPLPKELKYLK